ncbi:FR47-like protein [Lecanicillium sp. MT-2017a]|nr:FR47-like protein [Lecanicillium sp. MT-2017a]
MTPPPTVRHARLEESKPDVPTIYSFIQEAAAEQSPGTAIRATEAKLAAAIQFDHSQATSIPCHLRVLLLEAPESEGRKVAAMAMYYFNYSTWNAELGVILEELYVAKEFRGRGYAQKIIQGLAVEADKMGCIKMDWLCLKNNAPALKLYEKVGAKVQDWAALKVDEAGIAKLVEESHNS